MGQYAFTAQVRIQAPFNDTEVPLELADEVLPLRSVTVSNALTDAGGRFALELAPLFPFYAPSPYRQRPVADFIKPMSLVTIAVHHSGYGGGATRAPVPIMLGVVDDVDAPELWGGREPVRSVFVTGRSLAALLTDFRWWFHSYLAYSGAIQLPADVRRFFKQAPGADALRDESLLRTLGFLAIDEQLFDLVERSPVALMKAAYEFFVVGDPGRGREPFIKLKFPATLGGAGAAATVNVQQLPVAVRLRFDADAAQASYFDQRSRLTSQFLPLQMPSASCWDLLRYFAESPFSELYADTFGNTLNDAYVEIVARKPPWIGHIEYDGDGTPFVAYPTGGRRARGATLFDEQFGRWSRSAETVVVGDTDIIATPRMRRSLDRAISLYDVQPALFANAGSRSGDQFFQMEIPPLIDEDATSPSFIQRVGLRPLRVPVRSIATLGGDDQTPTPIGDIRTRALAYGSLLYEWNFRAPDFWSGSYLIEGNPHVRIGRRLLDRDRRREFYVVGVVHRMDFENEDGAFTTTVTVERGWNLVPEKSVTARAVGHFR